MNRHPTLVLASRHHRRSNLVMLALAPAAGKVIVMWYVGDSLHLSSTGKISENGQHSPLESKDRGGQVRRLKFRLYQLDVSLTESVNAWIAIDWVADRSTFLKLA